MKDNFRKVFLSQQEVNESRGSSVFDMSTDTDDPSWLLEATGKITSGNRKLKRTFTFPRVSPKVTRNRNLTKTERPRLQLKERLPKPEQMIKPKKVEFNDNVTSYSFDNYISSDEEANLLSQDIENVCFIESTKNDSVILAPDSQSNS
jgi:hypothetical protein